LQLEVAAAGEGNQGEGVEAHLGDAEAGVPSSEAVQEPKGKENF
jgi:hypothetical protein